MAQFYRKIPPVDIKPFRKIASSDYLGIPEIFEEFCRALADTFKLSHTFFQAISYDSLINEYVVAYSNDVLENSGNKRGHKEFVTKLIDLIPDDWPLYQLQKEDVPEELRRLIWPEALCAIHFEFDAYEKTTLFIYTFEESENVVFSKSSAEFLISAASYVMIVLQKIIHEKRMNELLYNDSLTDTPNRTYFYHMLVAAIQLADYTNASFAVLMVDIANVRAINDTYGYHIGDHIIKMVSQRLKDAIDSDCIMSRFSGNDFSIYIPNVEKIDKVFDICKRITENVGRPVNLEFVEIQPSVNIGISQFPHDGESVDKILKNAEAAMFQAKKDLLAPYKQYNQSITQESGKLLSLSIGLNQAITNDEFEMYYQAQFDIKNSRIASVEALIRWRHPTRGILLPYEFIPFAENNGRILDIDKIVLRKACEQAKKWHDKGYNLTIGVNISGEHFRDGAIVKSLADALSETNAPPHMIDIEILESTLIEDLETAISVLRSIKALGVTVSLDDFGSGYSSLEYLTMLPLDFLKVDRAFAMNMDKNPRNKIIIRTIIMLAKEMGFRVIVEGVETQEHLEFLEENGCDFAQGYHISRPLPLNELEQLIAKFNRCGRL